MKKVELFIKDKIQNHIMINANKPTCEKLLFKNFKFLQKLTKKNHKNLIKYSIINNAPVIKLRQIKKKKRKSLKEFPYILKSKNRISLSLKNILNKKSKKKNEMPFEKILTILTKKNDILKLNTVLQKSILTKKSHSYFRWFF